MEANNKEKIRKIYAIMSILVFTALMVYLFYAIGKPLIAYLKRPELFRRWVDEKGILGRLAFIGIVILQVVVAIIPGEAVEVAAGYTFGVAEGTALCILGMNLGSALIYGFVKKAGISVVSALFPLEKIAEASLIKNTDKLKRTVFMLFFIPGTPKDRMTYFVPLTRIKFAEFMGIAALARIPSVISSAMAGSALGETEYKTAFIVYAITAVFSGVSYLIYKKIRSGITEQRAKEGGEDGK